MYNYNFEMTYKSKDDKTYRKELLKALNMDVFDTKIMIKKLNVLLNLLEKEFEDIFNVIKKRYKVPFELDNFSCFQILFSWENLDKTHETLKYFFNNNIFNKKIILEHLLNI